MRFSRRALIGLCLLMGMIATPSSALLVQPIFLDMRFSGVRSNGGIRVVNDRNRPSTVEVNVSRLEIPEDGEAVFTPMPSAEDFLVFPAVATIPAGGSQIFRIRWIGEPDAAPQMFAFTTSELPVEIEEGKGMALQLLYAIQTIVAIGPDRGKPDLSVIRSEKVTDATGPIGVRLLFQNDGSLHGQVSNTTLTVRAGAWTETVTAAEMAAAVGLGLVPAGGTRWMYVPVQGLPAVGEVSVDADIP